MKRIRQRRAALISFLILALLIAVPVVLTWRQVRQERVNRALIVAVKRAEVKKAIRLLERGADPNCREEPAPPFSLRSVLLEWFRGRHRQQNTEAMTPLSIAVGGEAIEDMVRSNPDQSGHLIFVSAYWDTKNIALIGALLQHGANVDMPVGHDRRTPLYYALQVGSRAAVHLLLEHGARTTGANTDDFLFLAIGKPGLVADLLAHLASVKAVDPGENLTPLMDACIDHDVESVRLLLAYYASVNAQDDDGERAMDLSREPQPGSTKDEINRQREIIRLLKAAGAKQ